MKRQRWMATPISHTSRLHWGFGVLLGADALFSGVGWLYALLQSRLRLQYSGRARR
jgi:hypothetical protein